MAFKAIFQALGGVKLIDVTTNFKLFVKKNSVTKFAGLQILKVACRGGCFKTIYICLDR